jgi:hypothetical protein
MTNQIELSSEDDGPPDGGPNDTTLFENVAQQVTT